MLNYILIMFNYFLGISNKIVNYDRKWLIKSLIVLLPIYFYEQLMINILQLVIKENLIQNLDSYFLSVYALIVVFSVIILKEKRKNNDLIKSLPISNMTLNIFDMSIYYLKLVGLDILVIFPYIYVYIKYNSSFNNLIIFILLILVLNLLLVGFRRYIEITKFYKLNWINIIVFLSICLLLQRDIVNYLQNYFSLILNGSIVACCSLGILIFINILLIGSTLDIDYTLNKKKRNLKKNVVIKKQLGVIQSFKRLEKWKISSFKNFYVDNFLFILGFLILIIFYYKKISLENDFLILSLALLATLGYFSVGSVLLDGKYRENYRVLPINLWKLIISKIIYNFWVMITMLGLTCGIFGIFKIQLILAFLIVFLVMSLLSIINDLIIRELKLNDNLSIYIVKVIYLFDCLLGVFCFYYLDKRVASEYYFMTSIVLLLITIFVECFIIRVLWKKK